MAPRCLLRRSIGLVRRLAARFLEPGAIVLFPVDEVEVSEDELSRIAREIRRARAAGR